MIPTILDIAKRNAADAAVGLIDEATKATPEVRLGYARTIKGVVYKTLVRTGNANVSFRNAGEGSDQVKGTYENRIVETYILNPIWECDKAVADGSEDGADAFIAEEGESIVNGAFATLGKQFFYGLAADAKGFLGLQALVDDTMVVDAEGSGSDTTSVYAVKWGPKYCAWAWGMGGSLDLSDVAVQTCYDSDSKPYTAYVQSMLARPGLQVGHVKSIGRIKNIDSDKPLTDDLIASLLAKFPAGMKPDHLFMNTTAQSLLRNSRTATNPTGAPAPFPESAFNVPIQVTDSLADDEAAA